MSDPLTWALLLLAAGLVLVLVEFFVPSAGVLGFSAAACLVVAIVLAFRHSGTAGLTFMAVTVAGTPLLLALGAHLWPHTPIGRRVLLGVPKPEEVLPDTPHRRELKSLLGKVGRAQSPMMPSGAVEVDGHTIDALSEGPAIELGTLVKVIEVRGSQVVVRPTEGELPPASESPRDVRAADNVLAQPLESLGLDELNEPLS